MSHIHVNEARSDTYRDIFFADFKENKNKGDMRQAAVENDSNQTSIIILTVCLIFLISFLILKN